MSYLFYIIKSRTVIILIVIGFSFIKIYGQTYTPFIDTNSLWRDRWVPKCVHAASTTVSTTWDAQEYFKGDTIINGKSYSKLYITGSKREYSWIQGLVLDTTLFYCNYYIGAMREDTLKHVYYINTAGTEKLLYNFNLNVGDSVPYTNGAYNFYIHVLSIDSVFIYNKHRKRFNFDYASPLIEGVGRKYGLLGVEHWQTSWICLKDESKAYFYNNTYCFGDTTATLLECNSPSINPIDTNLEYDIKLYPNPTFSQLNIISNHLILSEITIFNLTGKKIKTITKNLNIINVSGLPAGIYFIKLIGSGEIITQKFIKQ